MSTSFYVYETQHDPNESKTNADESGTSKQAWVLQLKEEFNDLDRPQYYVDNDELELVDELQKAERYYDREVAEHWMKRWEEAIFEKFGEGAICNAGYTNMMKHFDWVEVEVEEVE